MKDRIREIIGYHNHDTEDPIFGRVIGIKCDRCDDTGRLRDTAGDEINTVKCPECYLHRLSEGLETATVNINGVQIAGPKDIANINCVNSQIEVESSLDKQVAGDHYIDMTIQPAEFCIANGMNYFESFAIKYICRHRNKNGKEDLEKAIHCLQMLIEMEYEIKEATTGLDFNTSSTDKSN